MRRVVLVTRRTRLEELVARHHTLGQARFYVEHLGDDFGDYLRENEAQARALRIAVEALQAWGRWQMVERALLPNFAFAPDDIVVALGQDGLVANVLKYLADQPVLGVNPDPARWDGLLLPFEPAALAARLPEVAAQRRPLREVSIAQARLSDGQVLRGVNDLFIGPRSHGSALYELDWGGRRERQSSSGLIVSTGLGSTAWMRSVVTGSMAIARALGASGHGRGARRHGPTALDAIVAAGADGPDDWTPLPWDSPELVFAVREPFPSRHSQAGTVFGRVSPERPLRLRSHMPEGGVIFSDGMESDFLRFTAGMEAVVELAPVRGRLVA